MCTCTAQNGDPKTLYSQKFLASRAAGLYSAPGHIWQVYKCPGGDGWHISSVRWNPWADAMVEV